jgi:hypothetical protein
MAKINMGLQFGLDGGTTCFPRKFRWLFQIEDISPGGNETVGQDASIPLLPPRKSSRPNLTFKELEAQHLSEVIYFPSKPDWKPLPISLYDMPKEVGHPVFEWIRKGYRPDPLGISNGWNPSLDETTNNTLGPAPTSFSGKLKRQAILTLYDGCGEAIEEWVYENAWPQSVNFGDLDMGVSDLVVVDLTLRYDRAYWRIPISSEGSITGGGNVAGNAGAAL